MAAAVSAASLVSRGAPLVRWLSPCNRTDFVAALHKGCGVGPSFQQPAQQVKPHQQAVSVKRRRGMASAASGESSSSTGGSNLDRQLEAAANNDGLVTDIDPATSAYIMQQTMFRIKDPKASLHFYSKVLGMRLLKRLDFPEAKFSLYFMGYESAEDIPSDGLERVKWTFSRKATIELTHNWGTESDPDFKGYHNGNSDPRGWGHIGVMVDDVYAACERFESLGVEFVKKPDDGRMKGLAFIKDPDGYWIEIFDCNRMGQLLS